MNNQSTISLDKLKSSKKKIVKSKRELRHTSIILKGFILPIFIVVLWELTGILGLISDTLLPRPSVIFTTFIDLALTGELIGHFQISLLRAIGGFLLGGTLGLLVGLAVGFSQNIEQTVDPTLQMFRTIPTLAVIPLFILWFGFGEVSKILLIAKGAFFPLYVNTFLGIRGVDSKLFAVAKVLEFNRWKQITLLILPAALPNILLGLRLSLGVAWLALVAAELMGSSQGVGYLIMDARQFSNTSVVFVGIIIFAVFGKLSDSLVRVFERRLLKWQDNFQG
ncbi:ABC transporter permease [Metabacillus bambusae]|uniref:ABC transporter permease n=1 Tax=Metabacillus bambusae TaxID=2795218 RepID=A0ABS3N9E3_9BACI|nr:ABC transporter permease [Metabacillus bambusae]MBO1514894.1 ABC transporter permease [Metabacillus bambusae]